MFLKKSVFPLLAVLFLTIQGNARTTVFLEYGNDCMTKMVYKEVTNTTAPNLVHFYAFNQSDNKLILELAPGTKGQLHQRKPQGIKPCGSVQFNKDFARRVNGGDIALYVVTPEAAGYRVSFVSRVSSLDYDGKIVYYNGDKFDFACDVSQPVGADNLSLDTSRDEIYYQGDTGMECMDAYTFRRNTRNTCDPYKDLTLLPDLGVMRIAEREYHGSTLQGTLKTYELKSINGLPVDDYVGGTCKGKTLIDPALLAFEGVRGGSKAGATTPPTPGKPSTPADASTTDGIKLPDNYGYPTYTGPDKSATKVDIATLADNTKAKNKTEPDLPSGFAGKGEKNPDNLEVPLPATKKAKCSKPGKKGFHVVQPEETLYSISRKTGISVADLAEWNNLSNENRISACSELALTPPKAAPKTPAAKEPDSKRLPSSYGNTSAKISSTKKKSEGSAAAKSSVASSKSKPAAKKTDAEAKATTASTPAKKINQKPQEVEGIHVVREGETLYSIARQYGYTVEKFMEFNGLESDVVTPLMVLKTSDCVCNADADFASKGDAAASASAPTSYDQPSTNLGTYSATIHIVEKGESLYRISQKYGTTVEQLMKLNNIKKMTEIKVGQKLRLK